MQLRSLQLLLPLWMLLSHAGDGYGAEGTNPFGPGSIESELSAMEEWMGADIQDECEAPTRGAAVSRQRAESPQDLRAPALSLREEVASLEAYKDLLSLSIPKLLQEEDRLRRSIEDYMHHIQSLQLQVSLTQKELARNRKMFAQERIAMANEALAAVQTGKREVNVIQSSVLQTHPAENVFAIRGHLLSLLRQHGVSDHLNLKLGVHLMDTVQAESPYMTIQTAVTLELSYHLYRKTITLPSMQLVLRRVSFGVLNLVFKPKNNPLGPWFVANLDNNEEIAAFLRDANPGLPPLPRSFVRPWIPEAQLPPVLAEGDSEDAISVFDEPLASGDPLGAARLQRTSLPATARPPSPSDLDPEAFGFNARRFEQTEEPFMQ